VEAIDILVFVGNMVASQQSDVIDITRSIELVTNLEHDLNANALKAVEYISTCQGMEEAVLGSTLVEISVNRMKDIATTSPRMTASEYQAYCNVVDWHRLTAVVRDLKDMCLERLVRFTDAAKDEKAVSAAQFGLLYGTSDQLSVDQLMNMVHTSQLMIEHGAETESTPNVPKLAGALTHDCEHH